MRKITVPTKAERAEQAREHGQSDAAPRPRLALKYGANADSRSRP